MNNNKEIEINLTDAKKNFEFASINDADLLRIKAYAVTEGENLNGTVFPRKILFLAYRTFVDKPVIIVPNRDDLPTGHGYDFKKETFDINKRKNIGHITDAYPVLVNEYGDAIDVYNVSDLDNYPDRQLRIVVDIVIYKNYYADISEKLQYLHNTGSLSFSMESVISAIKTDDNGKVATDISFTGLAIVDTPAFVNSKSIEMAEKEEKDMEFKEMYEAEKAKNDSLIAEKANVETELASAKDELTSTKEELANAKTELAEANATIESLKPYKEQVEVAEKKALGEERAAKLKKLGVEKDATELAEMSKDAFADELIQAAENFKPQVEVGQANPNISSNFHETKGLNENLKDILSQAIENLM